MKKLLIVLLAVSLVFAFAACGEAQPAAEEPAAEAETVSALPLGGSLPDYPLEGAAYGNYVKLETTAEQLEAEGVDSMDIYYAEGSDVPYIVVYRWANTEGLTLEETTEYFLASLNLGKHYESFEVEGVPAIAIYTDSNSINIKGLTDDAFYYVENIAFADGDDFVVINFFNATEELALGDSGNYLWIPAGYDPYPDPEDLTEHNAYFCADYDKSYWMPHIFIAEEHDSYEELQWYWGEQYPDGNLPIDEATYQSGIDSGWDKNASAAYYEAFGIDIFDSGKVEGEDSSFSFNVGKYTYPDSGLEVIAVDGYLHVGDKTYNIWLDSDLTPFPSYALNIFDSLHSK